MDIFFTKYYNFLTKMRRARIFRILIITVFLIVVFDTVTVPVLDLYNAYDAERIPYENFQSVRAYIDRMKSAKPNGVRVVFLGDSIIYGTTDENGSESIPAYYNSFMDKSGYGVEIFSFTQPLSNMPQNYIIMKDIINYTDVIIFNINVQILKDDIHSVPNSAIMYLDSTQRHDLYGLDVAGNYSYAWHLLNKWGLYKQRLIIKSFIAKSVPARFLPSIFSAYCCFKNETKLKDLGPFINLSKTEKEGIASKFRTIYSNLSEINESNIDIIYLKKIAELARNSNSVVIAIITPFNKELNDEYGVVNVGAYANYVNLINSAINGSVILIDYNFKEYYIPSRYYYSSDHFVEGGNRLFAEILANDTQYILRTLINP